MERSRIGPKRSPTDFARDLYLHGRYIARRHSRCVNGSLQSTCTAIILQNLESYRQALLQPVATSRYRFPASSRPAFAGLDSWQHGS